MMKEDRPLSHRNGGRNQRRRPTAWRELVDWRESLWGRSCRERQPTWGNMLLILKRSHKTLVTDRRRGGRRSMRTPLCQVRAVWWPRYRVEMGFIHFFMRKCEVIWWGKPETHLADILFTTLVVEKSIQNGRALVQDRGHCGVDLTLLIRGLTLYFLWIKMSKTSHRRDEGWVRKKCIH